MAANLGPPFLGGAGMVPIIAQELAAGNFPDSRESFHDYIYSKLILGEDKGNNPNINSSNPPVFPNTNLASSYPNPGSAVSSIYIQGSTSNIQDGASSGGGGSKVFASPAPPRSHLTSKSGSSKKKVNPPQQIPLPHISPEGGVTKVKKKSHHKKKEKTNICDVCGRGFAEKYTLNRHMLTHTHIKPYSCTKCNMAFSRSDGLAKHMAAGHRRIDAHHCDVCGGTFNSEVSYEQHRREYGNTLPFVCNLCMLAFSQCCHLNYHMKSHSLNKLNDSLNSDNQDNKHEAIDVSELIPDDFSPPKKESHKESFGFLYSSGASSGHLLSALAKVRGHKSGDGHHSLGLLDPNIVIKPEIDDLPACSALNNQMSAAGVGAHGSSQGNSAFDALSNLPSVSSSTTSLSLINRSASQSGSHLTRGNTSTTTSAYLPDTSGNSEATPISDMDMKKFFDIKIPNPKLIESLELQSASVGEDGLFRCGICGKGFTRKYHMQRHVKLHTRGPVPRAHLLDWTRRPYACGVCKMGFTRQHHLTRHMLIHTGERPHSCHVCGKAFRRYTNLSLHVRTVHGAERPFKCHICGRGFPRLYSLQRHHKLHAKHAASIVSESSDQLYKGFKAVGTVVDRMTSEKLPPYGSLRHSPGQSRESISSEHSDDSERYEQVSSAHEEGAGNLNPERDVSPLSEQDNYRHRQEVNNEVNFSPQADPRVSSTEHQSAMNVQEERLGQALQSQNSDYMSHHSTVSNSSNQGMRQQNPGQPRGSNEMSRPTHQGNETGRGQNQGQPRSSGDFNPQTSMQHNNDRFNVPSSNNGDRYNPSSSSSSDRFNPSSTNNSDRYNPPGSNTNDRFNPSTSNNDRFNPPSSIPNHNLRNLDLPINRSFSELDMREANTFSLAQRGNGNEGFSLSQQRIQSPHSAMNTIERPGSRSMLNPPGLSDKYMPNSATYSQQQSVLQSQRVSMDLSAVRNTMSPAGLAEQVSFAHNRHVELALSRGAVGDHPAYPHNHSIAGLQFPPGAHSLYQPQVTDNISHMELHQPNPSASPMPVHSHNNNIQY